MMVETKTSKVKNKTKTKKEKQRSRNGSFYRPTGVIQRIKPKKRGAVFNERNFDSMVESEEFDSDEHIENESDWHDELDVIKMPHLLGPSATKYSPAPLEHQHLSSFFTSPNPRELQHRSPYPTYPTMPYFGCYQILVQCTGSTPLISYVPCNYYQSFDNFNQPYLY